MGLRRGGGARERGCAVWNLTSIARFGRRWQTVGMGTGDGGGGPKDVVGRRTPSPDGRAAKQAPWCSDTDR